MIDLFVFGLGYTARRLVEAHPGWRVAGTVTSVEKAHRLAAELGVRAHVFGTGEGDDAEAIRADLGAAERVLVSVPTDAGGDPVLRAFGPAIAAAPRLAWIGYLSTIGVYGDQGGAWIDEATPPAPESARTRRRVEAEAAWLALGREAGKAVQVFRLAGIYGPGRNALVNLAEGTAKRVVKPGQVFNRIHVDDIVAVLDASLAAPRPGAIYDVADDEPAPPQDVVAFAAELAGAAPPPEVAFEDADLSPMARSFWGNNKRVRNARIRDELGVRLVHPTYREGLRALRSAGEGPPVAGGAPPEDRSTG